MRFLLLMAIVAFLGTGRILPVTTAIMVTNTGTLQTQVSDSYDRAIDQALHDKELKKAMDNVCRGC